MKKHILILCAIFFIQVIFTNQSPYIGFFELRQKYNDTPTSVPFVPLSQQPHIIHSRLDFVQLFIISQADSCKQIPYFIKQEHIIPILGFIDESSSINKTCTEGVKIERLISAGASGFIIVSSNPNFAKSHCRMYDTNKFFIATMSPQNFQKIQKYKNQHQNMIAQMEIRLKQSKKQYLQVWTSSTDFQSYKTIQKLHQSFEQLQTLQQKIEWTPRIASVSCFNQIKNICPSQSYVSSCACSGLFCNPNNNRKTSQVMIKEDIRQLLIFKTDQSSNKENYFEYMKLFSQKCLQNYNKEGNSDNCAESIIAQLNISGITINMQIDQFLQSCAIIDNKIDDKILKTPLFQILRKDNQAFTVYGEYPLVLLNKQQLLGINLNGELCRKLNIIDQNCFKGQTQTVNISSTISNGLIIMIILSLVAVGTLVIVLYRKKLKKQINKQVKMQVQTAISHYYALSQTTSTK